MARIQCRCGATLWNGMSPNDIQLIVYTDKEWDAIINCDSIDPLGLPSPKYDAWRCPECERIYFFECGNDKAVKIYALEK
ncbi:hypothetical protein SRRS_54090 [Sporomusa rhizae]